MIEQNIYIEILELFDLVNEEPLFKKYKQAELILLNDKEIQSLITKYNELNEEQGRIQYEPYKKELEDKKNEIEIELSKNIKYQEYIELYNECNEYLNDITKIIFEGIVNVKEDECCCGNK